MVFVISRVIAPSSLANLRAFRVSAVSPDWEIKITKVFLSINGSLYLNSEASSQITGIFVSLSIKDLATRPEL